MNYLEKICQEYMQMIFLAKVKEKIIRRMQCTNNVTEIWIQSMETKEVYLDAHYDENNRESTIQSIRAHKEKLVKQLWRVTQKQMNYLREYMQYYLYLIILVKQRISHEIILMSIQHQLKQTTVMIVDLNNPDSCYTGMVDEDQIESLAELRKLVEENQTQVELIKKEADDQMDILDPLKPKNDLTWTTADETGKWFPIYTSADDPRLAQS